MSEKYLKLLLGFMTWNDQALLFSHKKKIKNLGTNMVWAQHIKKFQCSHLLPMKIKTHCTMG